MKKQLLSSEVVAAIITVIGTLLMGIILGVLEGKIGFVSLIGFLATILLLVLLFLLYKKADAKVTAAAAGIILVAGFAVFMAFFRKPQTEEAVTATPPAPSPTTAFVTAPTQPAPTQPGFTPAATHPPQPTAPAPTQAPVSGDALAVPDAPVGEFFAPGPKPVGIAVAGDTIWIADGDQGRVYRLDRAGTPLGSFEVSAKDVAGLAWDGEALLVAAGSYGSAREVLRMDTTGAVLGSFPLPVRPVGLGWDAAGGTVWVAAQETGDTFLLQFAADGQLLQCLHVGIFGGAEALAWAPDGLWVMSTFGDWYRLTHAGEVLKRGKLPVGDFPYYGALAWDDQGALWLALSDGRKFFQIGMRQEEWKAPSPPTPQVKDTQFLPRPVYQPRAGDKTAVRIVNNLGGPLTLSIDSHSVHESAILQAGETWTKELSPGAYTVFASANVPAPVGYSSKELLLGGYEHVWVLSPP